MQYMQRCDYQSVSQEVALVLHWKSNIMRCRQKPLPQDLYTSNMNSNEHIYIYRTTIEENENRAYCALAAIHMVFWSRGIVSPHYPPSRAPYHFCKDFQAKVNIFAVRFQWSKYSRTTFEDAVCSVIFVFLTGIQKNTYIGIYTKLQGTV